jgi:hypothetical protein
MKCDYCDSEIKKETCYKSLLVEKFFCNFRCCEKYMVSKIEQLTKAEKLWHEEWFKQREIIGRLGCNGCKGIQETYNENKRKNNE